MTFLRKQFGCVKTVVLCFFGEWRDEDTRLRNPHPERNRIQETFGSKLQLIVYTALARATLFHFAHCLTNSAKAGSDMAIQQPMRSPAGGLRGLRYGGAEGSFPLGLMASQPDEAPHENRKILAFSTAFIILCGLYWR
jgi:hypothetical protein